MDKKKYSLYLIITLTYVLWDVTRSQIDGRRCTAQTCGECISQSPECAWCTQSAMTSRCGPVDTLRKLGCNDSHIVDPRSTYSVIQDEDVRDEIPKEETARPILLQPQNVTLKLTPNDRQTVNVTYRQAKNYPVDLYFLMDMSNSMKDDKEKMASLATNIAAEIFKLTNNVRFGFGTFVDKVTPPFTSMHPAKLKEPCRGCAPPYSFKHHLSLTKDVDTFKKTVQMTRISGNLDAPEGGLDAMMQVSVCGTQIGWRPASRKLLIYSSDEMFHSAGDGKLGGVVLPNDGECHLMEKTGESGVKYSEYTHDLKQDYPSVYHIARKVEENNINVIFAVPENFTSIYTKVSEIMEGSNVGELKKDSGNIVQLIRENYKKIAATIRLNAVHDDEFIAVNFRSKCLGSEMQDTQQCEGLRVQQRVVFEVGVEVIKCPADVDKRRQTVVVSPVGLEDTVTINVEIVCECDCEKPENSIPKSDACSGGNGTLACGICACNKGRFGERCQCGGERASSRDLESQCVNTAVSKLPCSGLGDCVCGQCQCWARTRSNPAERFSGKYCQCDDYSCNQHDDKICGGETRGRCLCGKCLCYSGYTGEACECDTSRQGCLDSDGVECSGNGQCVCGKCVCNEKKRCYGKLCAKCPECIGNCACNRDCVECVVFNSGRFDQDTCSVRCSGLNITTTDQLSDDVKGTRCHEKFEDDSGCSYHFVYSYLANNRMHILALKEKVCPKPVAILPIALGVAGGVLALGLLALIIWKIVTTIYDKVEYRKFEDETREPHFATEGNPLFRPARRHFDNPTWQPS